MKRIAILLSLVVAMSGCATIKGWFNNAKKENIQPPTPLAEFTPTLTVQKVWDAHPTSGAGESGARVAPVYADGKLFVAGVDGDVAALDAGSGRTVWSKRFGQRHGFILHHGQNSVRWAGGPAVDGGLLVVGGLEGEVQALDAASGADRWHAQVSSEVIAAPAIADGIVVVRTDDGRLFGLNAADGSRRWVYDRSTVPALSLRGNAAPRIVDGVVYAGEDNGKLVALRLRDGNVMWEQTLSPGEGRTELARLQDLDGGIAVADGVVYAAGYQGMTAALIADSGRPLWTHPLSSYTGVALAATRIYVIDADSEVWALDLRTGASDWKQAGLKYRWLGEASTMGNAVVMGDMHGWVHWLSAGDGKFAARVRLSKDPIQAAPLVVGDTVYVEDVDGEIGAYRVGK
ncbi:MAG: outer membrane protein assembly factor BamB [Xanthomonadaceae bacterium]|nr:outer membrane protein assembly factor BamB [Xanthomonadaceae bacterium]MDE1884492.1 outer membrane protein assembly factor BamB [Xanthomonadaceae bacterium]MDE2083634.1 outer membrane protein assembly factor BamB [Xanthomonadaceae bacterium]MDE2257461.1 outer membrane protein assembly factor BamB [Xanthomonadaceae bacterium]